MSCTGRCGHCILEKRRRLLITWLRVVVDSLNSSPEVRLRCDGEPATVALARKQKMRLDLEKRTGTELLANSCLWPWLIRHAGWVDSRFRVETSGATPHQDAYVGACASELLPFGELVLFRVP